MRAAPDLEVHRVHLEFHRDGNGALDTSDIGESYVASAAAVPAHAWMLG